MKTTAAIQELDGRELDDRAAAAVAELLSLTRAEVFPDDPPMTAGFVAAEDRHPPAHVGRWRALAWDGGGERLLGTAELELEYRGDNRHLAWVDVAVHPEARRRGLGSELLRAAAARCAADGRTVLAAEVPAGGTGSSFAAARGFQVAQVAHHNRLLVADLDRSLLEGWIERAPERAGDYSLVAWDGRCPDDLLDGWAGALQSMNDAPRGELAMEDMTFTPTDLRAREAAWSAQGVTAWLVCARHDPTGELAGQTELFFSEHEPWHGFQGDTGVLAAHRNRGLGRWLKATNLLRLLDERPEVRVVDTDNAGTNEPMLAINHALGFRRAFAMEELQANVDELLAGT